MIYVGVKQETLPALRQSLQKTSAEGTSLPDATDTDADGKRATG